jgi:tetratricopeptide (TPR) repeat protein
MSILRIPPRDEISRILRSSLPKTGSTQAVRLFELSAETIAVLQKMDLKNPIEITPAISKYVKDIIEKFKPKTELDKAAILFASFLPFGKRFEIGAKNYLGCEPAGLQMRPLIAAIYSKCEILFPEELLQLTDRIWAVTNLEYHLLLLSMMRAAGIMCSLKIDESSYETKVFVRLTDGGRYSLSIGEAKFIALDNEALSTTDDEAVGWFYYIKGQIAFLQYEERRQMEGIDPNPFAQTALKYLYTALNLKDTLFGAWNCLGATYKYQGQEKESSDAFAIGHYHEAMFYLQKRDGSLISDVLEHLRTAVDYHPEFPQAWLEIGKLLHQLGRQDEANLCLDRAWRYLKTDDDIDAIKLKADIKFYKGLVLQRQAVLVEQELGEEYDPFIDILEKSSITITERDMAYNPVIGRFDNYDQRRLEKAVECFEEALSFLPGFSHAWASKGQALLKLNRGEEAIGAFLRAVKIEPNNQQAWLLLGLAYLEYFPGENREKARKIAGACFARIFREKKTDHEFTKSLLLLAINYASLGKKEEALICLDIISRYGGQSFGDRAWKIRALLIKEKKLK